ncbi:purine hydroxlyse, gamma subunit [Gottschalkia acidurici 9a]|uniref:Purine hydroxlyse, gamma subunit n=1 Tax=Gottschalkia acidurici (strain ATCC 7906 / DSM 604 / BCRC 14475 / CIP 104303 / KCTC 5404 / NCIMB 10678 / 9a) TaxID=1128398 RepID=K0AYT9_GOTA9|nr:FAD binding domain-containing protein [Gottschalkia acidurici]AFS78948.1 purine hydroxlyse, gamma subunit [Gottschalkia acidurici 9a]
MKISNIIKAYNINEVTQALSENKGKATLIAGGTDIMIKLRSKEVSHSVLIDVSDVAEMKNINISDDEITIGAAVTFTEIVSSNEIKKALPGLWEACSLVGAKQIRNTGTIGGNAANGSPAADSIPPLLALGAKVVIVSKSEEKIIDIDDFFLGKGKTALEEDAVIKEFIIPMYGKKFRIIGFDKLGLRNALAISRISSAVSLEVEDSIIKGAKVASGALGTIPTVEKKMGEFLVGKPLKEDTIKEASDYFSDIVAERLKGRSSAEFKQEAVKGVITKALDKAFKQIEI